MNYKNIVLIGGGVLGSQIALQSAYCGYNVKFWLRSEESVERAKKKIDEYKELYIDALNNMENDWCRGLCVGEFNKEESLKKFEEGYNSLVYETDLAAAVKDADLVIEALAENIDAKKEFYTKVAPLLEEKTVIVTNSSTLLPSSFAKYTGREEKFLSLHFANHIWKNNTAEVMGHDKTDKKYFDEIIEFANSINMIALPIYKEKNGYLLNSMLVPFLLSALDLYVNGVSDPESIDKAWTIGTGAPNGPFKIMDIVGLETVKNIVEQYQKVPGLFGPLLKKMMMPYNFKGMLETLNKYISEGKKGFLDKE